MRCEVLWCAVVRCHSVTACDSYLTHVNLPFRSLFDPFRYLRRCFTSLHPGPGRLQIMAQHGLTDILRRIKRSAQSLTREAETKDEARGEQADMGLLGKMLEGIQVRGSACRRVL